MINLIIIACLSISFPSFLEAGSNYNISSTISNSLILSLKSKKLLYRDKIDESLCIELGKIEIDFQSESRVYSNQKESFNTITDYSRKEIEIADSIKDIQVIIESIKFIPFKPLIDYSSLDNISQSLLSWIISIERITNNHDKLEYISSSIKPIIKIIKQKRISLNHPFIFNYNIKNENSPTIKLLNLFNYPTRLNYSLVPIIREFCYFYSDKELLDSILKGSFYGSNDDIVQIVSIFLAPYNQRNISIELSKIIGGYSQNNDHSFDYIYDRMIKGLEQEKGKKSGLDSLELSDKEKSSLDFYDKDFVRNLIPFIENVSFPGFDPFWYNLRRLIFKWIIYRREQAVNTTDDENSFQESLKDIKSIDFIIERKGDISILSNSNSMIHDSFYRFNFLIKYEFLENNHLFRSFTETIRDFSDNIFKRGMNNQTACQLLKDNHFNGHFDLNIRLKYLILFHSPIKEMRDCILINDSQSFDLYKFKNLSIQNITDDYLEKLEKKGPENLQINLTIDDNYLPKPILEFLSTTDKRIEIDGGYYSVFIFLEILDREDLLTWKMVKNLAGFSLDNGTLGWNQEKFENRIKEYKKALYFESERFQIERYLKKLGPHSSFLNPIPHYQI